MAQTPPPEARDIVHRFSAQFPDGESSWYLLGSHADGTAIDLSDVDVLGLCNPLNAAILEWGWRTEGSYGGRVDLYMCHPTSLNTVLQAHLIPMLKGAIVLHGSDLRPDLPNVDLKSYQETVAFHLGQAIEHFHPDRIVSTPPNPRDEFLGFVEKAREWTGLATWTHSVVVLASKGATAVAATEGRFAGSRSEALEKFAECAAVGHWPAFCRDLVRLLRDKWRYRVPDAAVDREKLHTICMQLCEFESFCVDTVSAAGIPLFRVNRTPQS